MMLASISVPEILPALPLALAAVAVPLAARRRQVKKRRAEHERERELRRTRMRKRTDSQDVWAPSASEDTPVYGAARTPMRSTHDCSN